MHLGGSSMSCAAKVGLPPRLALVALALAGGWLLAVSARAQPAPEARDGLFITVPNPIDDKAVSQIERKIQEAIERQKRNITIVVFDFNPDGQPAGTSDWNSPNRLAEYIRNLQQATVPGKKTYPHMHTVAFVRNLATKHTVLPILACREIIMSSEVDPNTRQIKARLGDINRDETLLGEPTRLAYKGVADKFSSPDLVGRMLDRNLALKRVKTAEGPRYLSARSIGELEKTKQPFTVEESLPDALQAGNALFDDQPALELG